LSGKSRKRFLCLDCGVDTGKIREHYFVHDHIWLSVVETKTGMLCVEHLEERLGRKLCSIDFPAVCINDPKYNDMSDRLRERINAKR
jgi:hypothetical protein